MSESPGELIKQIAEPHPKVSDLVSLGWGLRTCVSSIFSRNADTRSRREDKRGINEEMRINAGIYTTHSMSVARICGGGIKEGRCRMLFLIWEIPK